MQDRLFYSSNNYIEAKQVQDLLDQNNIVNYLKNEHIQNLFGDTRFLLGKDIIAGDIKIMVSEADFERACAVIEESGILAKTEVETGAETLESEATMGEGGAGHPDPVVTEDVHPAEVGADNRNSVKIALRGRSAEPNTNIFQMVTFSFLSFLLIPVFFNIKNFVHFWRERRATVILSIILTAFGLIFPFVLIMENINFAIPFLYMFAIAGSVWLMTKGYIRFKEKHDIVSILMTLPFILVMAFLFIFLFLINLR